MNTKIEGTLLNFKDIFEPKENNLCIEQIFIPKIQRDYAHGRKNRRVDEIRNDLLKDIKDALNQKKTLTLDYIYGDIEERKNEEDIKINTLVPLDGQQRLTTLFLLYWYAIKKESITEFCLKGKFSYETRPSAREFCKFLIEFEPDFNRKLSEQIKNDINFLASWEYDPTISSMLNMLDVIDEKFKEEEKFYENLNNCIKFYFLSIKDMGETDRLYINMNSRGKPLSDFENVKAELKKMLDKSKKIEKNFSESLMNSFDGVWTDVLWQPGKDIDTYFINYIKFICEILCFNNENLGIDDRIPETEHKDKKSENKKELSPLGLVKKYFDSDNPSEQKNNVEELKKYFDYLVIEGNNKKICSLEKVFEINFYKDEYEPSKIKNYDNNDIITRCFNGNLDNADFIRLYAILSSIKNNLSIEDFRRRYRIINNLVQHSQDEIRVRKDGNTRPAILKQVDYIIETGKINPNIELKEPNEKDNTKKETKNNLRNFNSKQLEEEKLKIEFLKKHNDKKDLLFKLEDNEMLKGKISVVGVDNYELFDKFINLFENKDLRKIDCALMTIGDKKYCVKDIGAKYQFGVTDKKNNNYVKSWYNLFDRFDIGENDGNLKTLLVSLLKDERSLDEIKEEYIQKCLDNNLYDFRYYYVNYDSFEPIGNGKYYWNNDYDLYVMETGTNRSKYSYNPYLKKVSKNNPDIEKIDSRGLYALSLGKDKIIECVQEGFKFTQKIPNSPKNKERIYKIDQVNGIDKKDRIKVLEEILKNPEKYWNEAKETVEN